ncbi:MAG: D-2-hydroxyacid dehydrogenase [Alphaproteobacteria bacterium]|nr:D-2-hydroxyacid dehydrogenase [Alphaproteobacteria bacterium]
MPARQIPCDKPADEVVLLVQHHLSHLYLDRMNARFPRLRKIVVDRYADLPSVLSEQRPDVALAFRLPEKVPFPREMLLNAPSLKWLSATGAGIDHLVPWDAQRIMVTNASGIHAQPMAEYAVWAVLNQTLRVPMYAAQQKARRWQHHESLLAEGHVAMIVGLGRIGRTIAERLRPFGVRTIGVRQSGVPDPAADETIGIADMASRLPEADFVILVLPSTPRSRGLFDDAMLGRMKPGAHLINLARGRIVDEDALLRRLQDGRIASATLDVFATEPLPESSPLWTAPNAILTPHVSGDVVEWQRLSANLFMDNLEGWLAGEPVFNLCDPEAGY